MDTQSLNEFLQSSVLKLRVMYHHLCLVLLQCAADRTDTQWDECMATVPHAGACAPGVPRPAQGVAHQGVPRSGVGSALQGNHRAHRQRTRHGCTYLPARAGDSSQRPSGTAGSG